MFRFIFTFIVIFIFSSLSLLAQDRLAYYNRLEQYIDADKLEEILNLKSEIVNHTSDVDTLTADIYSIYGETYLLLSNFDESLNNFEKGLNVAEKLVSKVSERHSNLLYNISTVYLELGDYDKALNTLQTLIKMDGELHGKSSERYLETILYYTDVLIETGKYNEALKSLNDQLKLSKGVFHQAIINTKKGDILNLLGNYEKSQELISASSNTYASLNDTLSFALAQSALGLNYVSQGKFPQAEQIFIESKNRLNELPDTEFYVDNVNNNLALAQMALGRSETAIAVYNNLLEKDSIYYGVAHPKYITSLINIGTAYHDIDAYDQAEKVFLKGLKLVAGVYGENSEVEATLKNNIGNVYRDKGEYELANNSFNQAAKLFKQTLGDESAEYSTAIFNKGKTLLLMQSDRAEKAFIEALKVRKKLLGTSHPKYSESTNYLGIYYWQKNDLNKARKYFEESFVNFFDQIKQFFPILSEEEKTKFYVEKLKPAFEQYNTLAVALMGNDPSILGELYNYQLRTKGIIMVATERLRSNIYDSQDSTLIIDFEQWKKLKERLSKLYSNNDPRQNLIDSLKTISNALEKSLVNRSSTFGAIYDQEIPTWQDVQNKLEDGEAAVEIIRFRKSDPQLGGKFTDEINYLALIIDKQSKNPRSVLLTRGKLMEGRFLNNYRNSMRYQIQDNFTYKELWEPLRKEFNDSKKVFISPDGVYNQVNLSTLMNPETGNYLIKEIVIQEVTSTRDLLAKSNESTSSSSKVFFGFPSYTSQKQKILASTKERSLRGGLRSAGFSETRGLRGGLLRYMRSGEGISTLPGTKKEVEEITQIYDRKGASTEALLEVNATESVLKKVESPEVLHIATHGYFLETSKSPNFGDDKAYYQNPLLRAGLIMAGAEDFLLTGDNSLDNEDGILTAFEAMNMDLNNTELVVLSACETGLGEVSNGEGVYGLQRAFKIAGAKNIVMSMWNVDDDATQRLMTLFYEKLNTGKNQSKFDAFRQAQIQLMDEYDAPFYWGAFKIVGE